MRSWYPRDRATCRPQSSASTINKKHHRALCETDGPEGVMTPANLRGGRSHRTYHAMSLRSSARLSRMWGGLVAHPRMGYGAESVAEEVTTSCS